MLRVAIANRIAAVTFNDFLGVLALSSLLGFSALGKPLAEPRIEMVQRLADGSEGQRVEVRCVRDVFGRDRFFCEVLKFRSGVEIAVEGIYSHQLEPWLDQFLMSNATVRGSQPKEAFDSSSHETRGPKDSATDLLSWKIRYQGKELVGGHHAPPSLRRSKKIDPAAAKALQERLFSWANF